MFDHADADNALVAIGKELERNLNDWEAWTAKADVLCLIGLYGAAIRCCDKAQTLNPDCELAWIIKGNALINSEIMKRQKQPSQKPGNWDAPSQSAGNEVIQ